MRSHRPPYSLVNLACGFLAGPWNLRSLTERGKRACLLNDNSVRKLVRQLIAKWPGTAPAYDDLLAFLRHQLSSSGSTRNVGIRRLYWIPMTMSPRGLAAETWSVPPLTSPGQLAEWLGIAVGELDWLADCGGLNVTEPNTKLHNYCCRWQPRRRGRFRLVESPKARLKIIQRKILHDILDKIPPHQAAHGFRAGRSIKTFAAPHASQRIVLRFDLRDFFPTVRRSRIHALFCTAGYPHDVARLLTGLCTSRVPLDVWEQRPDPRPSDDRLGERLRGPHLPQGAPTSPALANLCAYRLDIRLAGLAKSVQAVYTRYADDLAFSGGDILDRFARRFQVGVAVIAAEEGFDLHFQKSRFMRQSVCQQLAGIVVNRHPNVRRGVYDELKAILTNCVRHGPASQNRASHSDFRGHLLGRIAHVGMIHPVHGAKMRALFDRIAWPLDHAAYNEPDTSSLVFEGHFMPVDWKPFVELVHQKRSFLITTHIRPDPDGLGSQLGLADALRCMGKEVHLVISSTWPPRYDFLDPQRIIRRFEMPGAEYRQVEAVIVLDTGTWNQLGDFGPFLKTLTVPKVVIDHHISQDDLGAQRFVDTKSEATGRLVYEAVQALGQSVSPSAANALFAALATDTGWFRHKNTTASTFTLGQKLVEAGAQPTYLYEQIYEQNSLARLNLVGLVLQRLKVVEDGLVAYTEVRRDDYGATGAIPQDTEDLVNYTRSLAGVEVGVFFMEQPAGGIKISFRSRDKIDVAHIAEGFGGGGHRLASGAVLNCSLPEAEARVLGVVSKALAEAGDK